MKPAITVFDSQGLHNANFKFTRDRHLKLKTYENLSTICIIPAVANVPPKVVVSWMGLMPPMNQPFLRILLENMEVGEAYNSAIEQILGHPELSKWKYVLTLETDNAPPPDGLLKLYENMDKVDVCGGLYFTKGEGGVAQIWGNPSHMPKNYSPQPPIPDTLQPCNGTGMGFTLFKLAIFKKIPKPWFKTVQEYTPGVGAKSGTQDLYFAEQAAKYGIKMAVDTRVKVGHLDSSTGIMW